MGIKVEQPGRSTGIGYYRTSVWDARELVEKIASEGLELEEDEPSWSRYDDSSVFKVTITVEEV